MTPIVVDNASCDRTLDKAHGATVQPNPTNRGFAGAVNQGFEATSASAVLVLNPDVTLIDRLDPVVAACRTHGLAAGKLIDASGAAQSGFSIRRFPTPQSLAWEILGLNRLFPSNSLNRSYRYLDRDLDAPGPVEQPAGAFLMIRKDVWERLGGFDEQFHPVWFEDVDFCRRAAAAGYRAEFVPSVTARHKGGDSVRGLSQGCRDLYWYASLLRYAAKYFSPWENRGISLTVLLSSVPRMIHGVLRERSFSSIRNWVKIIAIASHCLVRPGAVRVSPENNQVRQ
jgi:GT2 family glycosyltransferase